MAPNRENNKNGFFTENRPNGHLAFLAFPDFSDKIAPADWPSFCRGILDSQDDTVECDKMMLGAQNNIPRLPQRSYNILYGGFASKKGVQPAIQQAAAAPPQGTRQDVLTTYGIARQRTSAYGACRKFVTRKRYEGIRLEGRCSKAAPRLLRGCSEVALMFL